MSINVLKPSYYLSTRIYLYFYVKEQSIKRAKRENIKIGHVISSPSKEFLKQKYYSVSYIMLLYVKGRSIRKASSSQGDCTRCVTFTFKSELTIATRDVTEM